MISSIGQTFGAYGQYPVDEQSDLKDEEISY